MVGLKTIIVLTITVGAALALYEPDERVPAGAADGRAPVVKVEPGSATIASGDSLQLRATLLDDDGSELRGQHFTWWSPDRRIAVVDENGMVVGLGTGFVSIAAITADRDHSGFADITVVPEDQATAATTITGQVAAPPSAETATSVPEQWSGNTAADPPNPGPNEPSGYVTLVRRPFDTFAEDGWRDRHQGGNQTIANGAMRITFPPGFVGGYASGASNVFFAQKGKGYRSIYIAHDLLLSPNWQGHRSEHNKVWYINTPDGRHSILSVKAFGGRGVNEYPLVPTATQTKNSVDGRGRGSNLYPNLSGPKIRRGQRASVEIIVTLNSAPGAHDGELHIWIDGGKTHEFSPARRNGINWYDANDGSSFGQLKWVPVWGGGSDDTVTVKMFMEMSRVYLSAL